MPGRGCVRSDVSRRATAPPRDDRLGRVARRASIERLDLVRAAGATCRGTCDGDDVGVGRVGAADADAHAREARVAELALERLQAVVAGQAAADARADVAERQVDLVVQDEHAVEVLDAVGAARRAGRAARPRS